MIYAVFVSVARTGKGFAVVRVVREICRCKFLCDLNIVVRVVRGIYDG